MPTQAVQAGIRENAQLLEFCAATIRSSPEFRFCSLSLSRTDGSFCMEPQVDRIGANRRSKSAGSELHLALLCELK